MNTRPVARSSNGNFFGNVSGGLENEKANFAPIALFETSTGEKFDWEKDIYLESLHGEIDGNGKKQGNLGFILKDPNGENVEWVKMITSDVVDQNKNILSKSKEIKLEF
jgi:hypothetical protein